MLRCIRTLPRTPQNVITPSSRASSLTLASSLHPKPRPWPTTSHLHDERLRTYTSSAHPDSKPKPTSNASSISASTIPHLRPDPTQAHTNLDSFLKYTSHKRLSRTTPTYHGTLYEYLTQTHLQSQLGFNLTRIGGRGDSGIDLLGTWSLPASIRRTTCTSPNSSSSSAVTDQVRDDIRVVIQCKRLTRSAGPNLMRELEGSFRGAPTQWRGESTLGVMVCTRAATKGVREAMGRSNRGLVWVMLEEVPNLRVEGQHRDNMEYGEDDMNKVKEDYDIPSIRMGQFLYNAAAASKCGLEGLDVGLKYDDAGREEGVQLSWLGKPILFQHVHQSTEPDQ